MKSHRSFFYVSLLAGWMAFGQGCRQDNSTLLVRLDNRDSITVDEYRLYMQTRHQAANISFEEKRTIVMGLVDQHLKALTAVDENLHTEQGMADRLRDLEERELISFAHEKYLVTHFVNDSIVTRFRSLHGREVRVQNIVVRYIDFAGSNATRTKDNARAVADSIYRVARDTSFGRLAEAVSDFRDPKSQKGFSRIEKFKFGALPMDYENAVFSSAPRTVLAPIDLPGAFLIPYVLDFSTDSLAKKLSDDDVRKLLRGRLDNLDRPIYMRYLIEFTEPLYEAAQVTLHDNAIDTLTRKYPAGTQPRLAVPHFSSDNLAMPVLTFEGKTLTIHDLLTVKGGVFNIPRPERTLVVESVKNIVREELLMSMVRKSGLDQSQEFRARLALKRNEILADKAVETKLKMADSVGAAELRRYYEAHMDKFRTAPYAKVGELYSPSESEIEEALRLLKNGVAFENVVDSLRSIKGGQISLALKNPANLSPGQKNEMTAIAFDLGQDEFSEVIPRKNGGFSILKLMERRDAQRQPFETVRRRVETQYRNDLRAQREMQWLNDMKRKMNIVVYENLIK